MTKKKKLCTELHASVLTLSAVYGGFEAVLDKTKTIKLIYAASPLSTQN